MKRVAIITAILILFLPAVAAAHCDTANGPVVAAGKLALEKNDLSPAMKWVKPDHEQELRDTFTVAVAARAKGGAAMQAADRLFLETLVRLHRAGEGEPFEGIKPAGTDETPALVAADDAVDKESLAPLQRVMEDELARRFRDVIDAKKKQDESVDAGRAYVAAYADFIHYVLRLEATLTGGMSAPMDEMTCPMMHRNEPVAAQHRQH